MSPIPVQVSQLICNRLEARIEFRHWRGGLGARGKHCRLGTPKPLPAAASSLAFFHSGSWGADILDPQPPRQPGVVAT